MKWIKQTMWVMRSDTGVIVGLSEVEPPNYEPLLEKRRERAYRATENAGKQITEYARKKIEEKRMWMGGD